jgi:hypothetical protein
MKTLALALLALVPVTALAAPVGADEPAPAAPADPATAVTVPVYANTTCPIMGKPASKALFAETDKGRIYVCCPPCIAKIKADPERAYATAFPTLKKAGNVVCPVTGERIGPGAPTVILQGYEVSLCCPDCVAKAKAASQTTLVKALRPEVKDVGNATCPITGKPVVENAYCLVGTDLVRLSAPSCVDDVRRDPAKALAAAKAIAAKQTPPTAKPAGEPTAPAK